MPLAADDQIKTSACLTKLSQDSLVVLEAKFGNEEKKKKTIAYSCEPRKGHGAN